MARRLGWKESSTAIGSNMQEASEFRSWLCAFILMLGLSVTVLASRFMTGPVFDLAFEICILYIPTSILFIITVSLRTRKSKHDQHIGN